MRGSLDCLEPTAGVRLEEGFDILLSEMSQKSLHAITHLAFVVWKVTRADQKLVSLIVFPSGMSKINLPRSAKVQKPPLIAFDVHTYVFCLVLNQCPRNTRVGKRAHWQVIIRVGGNLAKVFYIGPLVYNHGKLPL